MKTSGGAGYTFRIIFPLSQCWHLQLQEWVISNETDSGFFLRIFIMPLQLIENALWALIFDIVLCEFPIYYIIRTFFNIFRNFFYES